MTRRQWVVISAVLVLGCCASTMRNRTTEHSHDVTTARAVDQFVLAADGGRRHTVERQAVAHTELAISELGDPRVRHDTQKQELRVLRARTTMRDGTVVEIAANSVTETTPDALAVAPDYADVRETVITQVGLETGCSNDLAYALIDHPSTKPYWGEVQVHLSAPVTKRIVSISMPPGMTWNWECLGCEVAPTTENGTTTFAWENLEPIDPDPNAVEPLAGAPRLVFSNATSWSGLADNLLADFEQKAEPTDLIRNRARALTEHSTSARQRFMALWRFVAEDLATVDWPLDALGFEPSSAQRVLMRSYGHALDKAVLLASLLNSAGIESRPTLISRDRLFAREVPALSQLRDVWLIAKVDDREVWLSPTRLLAGDGRAHLSGLWALDLEVGVPLLVQPPQGATVHNQSRLVVDIRVANQSDVSADVRLTLTGTYSPFYELTAEQDHQKLLTRMLGSLWPTTSWKTDCSGCFARVEELSPHSTTLSYRVRGKLPGHRSVMEVIFPWAVRSQVLDADLHRPLRQTDSYLRSNGIESTQVTVVLPKDWTIATKLPSAFLSNTVGSFVAQSTMNGHTIEIDTTLTIEKRILDPDDYLSLRDLSFELHHASNRSILAVTRD